MKKIISYILSIFLLTATMSPTVIFGETYSEAATEAVTVCTTIGVLLGTGGGVTEEYLDSTPLRYQGAVMLLRLKSLLSDATSFAFTENYTDYEDLAWTPDGHNMLGYIKANEDVGFAGYPDGTFLPNIPMDAKQYYKLMLETLGYEYGIDYTWNTAGSLLGTMEFAQSIGLTWLQGNTEFTVRDLAIATNEALKTTMKTGGDTLAQKLVDDGIINSGDAESVGLIESTSLPVPTASLSIGQGYETAVITGETVMTITVDNVTFISTVGSNSSDTTTLLNGLSGNLSSPVSWDSVVSLDHSNVTRLSDTQLLINLEPSADYRISEDETLTLTLSQSLFNEDVEEDVEVTASIENVGAGTIDSPWELYTEEDFSFVKTNPDRDYHYILMNNLDFTGFTDISVDDFRGVFDGNSKIISNINITSSENELGLFNQATNAVVKNLTIKDSEVRGEGDPHTATGALVGRCYDSDFLNITIDNVYVGGNKFVGGMIGSSGWMSTITNCNVINSEVWGAGEAKGGLIGHATNTTVDSCNITDTTISNNDMIGGIIGKIYENTSVNNCQFNGSITGSSNVGGIIGCIDIDGTVTNSKSYGDIYVVENGGGIVGNVLGTAIITDNYCGLTSFRSYMITTSVHRIVGACTLSDVTLENTASLTAYNRFIGDTNYAEWVSDLNGLDGQTELIFVPLFPIEEL